MSKTKGNVIDPIEIVKQFGTDAVRFTLASMASPGTDIAFNVARTEGYRAFANKIWNAARFLFLNVDRAAEVGIVIDHSALGGTPSMADDAPLEARWIVAELHDTADKVNQALENNRFDDAANTIYQFFWGSFCDWYLEIVKLRLDFSEDADKAKTSASLVTLVAVFEAALRLLSPFMPFLTEELWHAVYNGNPPAKSIALTRYPQAGAFRTEPQTDMEKVQGLIVDVRALRKQTGAEEKEEVPIRIHCIRSAASEKLEEVFLNNRDIIERLAKVSKIDISQMSLSGSNIRSNSDFEVQVLYEKQTDVIAERERLTKERAKVEKVIVNSERQLNNPGFTAKAPTHIVEGLRKQLGEARRLQDKIRGDLVALPPE
jgi:valyl-tRNA synthetase